MNISPKIAILLSTYNGEKYLSEQLDSVLAQTYQNLIVIVRDDGSSDGTLMILEKYSLLYKGKIHIVPSESKNFGASGSFSFLIEYVLEKKEVLGLTSTYMMFCDQDDIWLPEKVKLQISKMLATERNSFAGPILVHSDLRVVSATNQLIAGSFVQYQGLEIGRNRFTNIIISNLVTGCTALINEQLARKAIPIPKNAIMHDWWLALVAAAFGEVIFLNTPLVSYRQHGRNTIGAKEFSRIKIDSIPFWRRVFKSESNQHLLEVAIQAKEFREIFGSQMKARANICLLISSFMNIDLEILQRAFYRIARML
ncbi:MAG: glycosyltransferase family 2 protein [Gammaproteobacteria bacterium]|nr:glycosyltransferase family 2 protein [Gammaproteobacteria bacterium]